MSSTRDFERASAFISSSTAPPSTEQKLRLYALYKIATVAAAPPNARPGMFDFQGRAKWDSWSALGGKGEYQGEGGQEKARETYVEEAMKMGMKREVSNEEEGAEKAGEGAPKEAGRRQGNKEAMVRVSMMADEHVDADVPTSKLHELCIDGDAGALDAYLKAAGKSSNLNELDAYGFSALGLATDRGHVDVVKVLLARGADKDLKDQDGNTPLQLAEISENDELIALLRA